MKGINILNTLLNLNICRNVLFHFILILLTLFNMYYSTKVRNGSFNFINKWISQENSIKLNKIIEKGSKYVNKYLLTLIIINILNILFCVLCNLTINIVLNNHLDHFIE